MKTLRIGTRGSRLARWQADWVAARLRENGIATQVVEIRTGGDVFQTEPIRGLGGTGVFTKEIQSALREEKIDVAVHSLKDLPTEEIPGLRLAAVPARESYRDALCCGPSIFPIIGRGSDFSVPKIPGILPPGAKIGTGSSRRKTQLEYRFPGRFRIEEIRGNVDTRLQKLNRGDYDAIILAEAGLKRLALERGATCFLEPPFFLPAAGQGALALEIRAEDGTTCDAVAFLNDAETSAAVHAERSMMKTLRGGCLAPIAALGRVQGELLVLHGRILSPDGSVMIEAQETASQENAVELGETLAQTLFRRGAEEILRHIRPCDAPSGGTP